MAVYQGKGVYGAVAIGKVYVFGRQEAEVRRIEGYDVDKYISRVK